METITELQITDLHTGTGKEASKGALLIAHYEGTLQDGSVFDSSHSRGRPIEFVVGTGRVIQGWDQGLMGMREGGKRKLVIPAHLAYGERAIGRIPPNSALTFVIDLIEVRTRD
ncbi:FKBP-type peptidyl-prolyl cis-trans isomerase [bacterium]|jgi:peptidylprolyl isomerase|nr:FKBP-type peptidyl-prolyl cis-trans isomerase [bacterium]